MVKRFLFPLLILLFVTQSLNAISWHSFGAEYNNSTSNEFYGGEYVEATLDAVGFTYSFSVLSNAYDVGLFLHTAFLRPWGGIIRKPGDVYYYNFNNTKNPLLTSIMAGFAIREPISYLGDYYFGIGPNIHILTFDTADDSIIGIDVGVGFKTGYVFYMSPTIFIDSGVLFDYSFTSHTKKNDGPWVKATDFGMYSLRTYIGIGLSPYI